MQIDYIVRWFLGTIIALCAFFASIVFYGMQGDISTVKGDVIIIKVETGKLKQQLDDHIKESDRQRNETLRALEVISKEVQHD